jgi:predicted CXXCH cytochrome family protein
MPAAAGSRRLKLTAATLIGSVAALAAIALLTGAMPRRMSPRTPAAIESVLGQGPHAGDCQSCHTMHAEGGAPNPGALLAPNDNLFCGSCHADTWTGPSYPGLPHYTGSAHGGSLTAVWPGPVPPPRIEAGAAGKCLNCHDPHGWEDAAGLVPFLGLSREESLCLACHDGAPAADVRSDYQKPFRHPGPEYAGRHSGMGEALPTDFGRSPANLRHAECEDCHNPHVARSDAPFVPGPDRMSKRLLGVSRVAVVHGGAGSSPVFNFIPGADTLTSPGGESQLCYKCHSSWTTQPSGQTDLARELNPNNPSFHPVESLGANTNIAFGAFVAPWGSLSRTRCTDCHGSDDGFAAGPHGSLYQGILKRPYPASAQNRPPDSGELCFSCHSFDVYGNPGASDPVRAQSRFNKPGVDKGHAEHAGLEVPCYACHVTHGSTTLPNLLVTGRSPGIVSYTRTLDGGTCAPTCHGSQSYTVNYAR